MEPVRNFFFQLGSLSKRLFDKIGRIIHTPQPTIKDKAWGEFCAAGGEPLRLNYDTLSSSAVVFDLGGYEGQWASDIYSRYLANIYIFEVYTPFYNNIVKRFAGNNNINVYNFGLASETRTEKIAIDAFSTSAFKKSGDMVDIQLKKASNFIVAHKITKIDLMKINIEGAEYDLLKHLIDSNTIHIIENLQIQFHDFVPNAFNEMTEIRNMLSKTHYPTYKFDFIWDNWKLKNA
ncbi:MAG: FkbM family methyltransferase [Bacteroidota bacterium]